MTMINWASLMIGCAIGFIASVILAIILWKYDPNVVGKNDNPAAMMVKGLVALAVLLLGGSFGNIILFTFILSKNGMGWFILGEGLTFLLFSIPMYWDWYKNGRPRD